MNKLPTLVVLWQKNPPADNNLSDEENVKKGSWNPGTNNYSIKKTAAVSYIIGFESLIKMSASKKI